MHKYHQWRAERGGGEGANGTTASLIQGRGHPESEITKFEML